MKLENWRWRRKNLMRHNSCVIQAHFQLLARKFFSPEASQTQFEKERKWKKINSLAVNSNTKLMSPEEEHHWPTINHKGQKSVDWTSKKVNTGVIFLPHWPLNLFVSAHLKTVCSVLWSLLGFSPKLLCFSTTGLNSWPLMASKETTN